MGETSREAPIFPELRLLLMEAFEQAEPGAEFVISRCRDRRGNLRTHRRKIIDRAGLEPWPKTFHNFRSSRQTELCENHPAHVVCAWLGNTEAVARGHHLQIRDSDFERAVDVPRGQQGGAASGAQAAQTLVQPAAESNRTERQPRTDEVGRPTQARKTEGLARRPAPDRDSPQPAPTPALRVKVTPTRY